MRFVLLLLTIVTMSFLVAEHQIARGAERAATGPGAAPTPIVLAVQANNDFAGDLYLRLAREHEKKNLFFSPYSIMNALMMTLEGARGETARQMGTVLRFPKAARRTSGEVASLPWDMELLHTGMAELRQRLMGGSGDASQAQDLRDRIKTLEQEYQTLTTQITRLEKEGPRAELGDAVGREVHVVDELNRLHQQVNPYELQVANALWGEQTFSFRPQFMETLREAYRASALSVDFVHNAEAAREQINLWVEHQTQGRIKNPLTPRMLSSDTRLVLANAIYFKGNWADQFEKTNTEEGNFTLPEGPPSKVQFMSSHKVEYRYAELLPDGSNNEPVFNPQRQEFDFKPNPDGFQILELPYRGHTLAMLVLLPKSADKLAALEKQLTADNLQRWTETLRKQKVRVFLPKFTMETLYELPSSLSNMGMPLAFQPGGFTGMSDAPEAKLLALSQVVHKAFVDVNEEGTEAAAATVGVMMALAARLEPPTPTFRADHPFVFLIRDNQSGAILFLGRVTNPLERAS